MPLQVPRDPLARFLDIATALAEEKRWWENRTILRYAALPLVLAPGEPAQVAARAAESGRALAEQSGWFSDLRGAMRWVIAALLAADGRDAARSGDEIIEVRERMRHTGVRRGGAFETVAATMLHLAGRTSDRDVQRLRDVYEGMKRHHWWLTGPEDLPACALLTVHGGELAQLSARIEGLYARLRGAGLAAGDGLQMASHVLCLARGGEDQLAVRFVELHRGFLDQRIRMWDCDRDELALLCLLDEPAARTAARVVEHRTQIRARLAKVGPTASFSFACGTAWLAAHAGATLAPPLDRDVQIANLAMATNAARALQQDQSAAAGASASASM
jgi:hypothetical protein